MRLNKGMKKAFSLALSAALIITSANVGSVKSKAADADVFDTAITTKEYWTENEAKKVVTGAGIFVDVTALKEAGKDMDNPTLEVTTNKKENTDDYYGGFNYGVSDKGDLGNQKKAGDYSYKEWKGSLSENIKDIKEKYLVLELPDRYVEGTVDFSFKLYDASYAPIDYSQIPEEVVIKNGETAKIAVKTAGNATFNSNAYAKTNHTDLGIEEWKSLAGVSTTYSAEDGLISIQTKSDECKAVGLEDTQLYISFELPNGAKIEKWLTLKILEDGITTTAQSPGKSESKGVDTTYAKSISYDATKVEKAPVVEEETEVPTTTPSGAATTTPTGSATTAPTGGATTAPTGGATTAPTGGATTAPTETPTEAPTEAPKGNMDKFNVSLSYVGDDSWGEQSWGDKSVDVTGDGKYSISYEAQSDSKDIFMMILSTDLYKGSLNDGFKFVPTYVAVGSKNYKVNAEGGWCFSDQKEENPYRYNIVNPYNGPIGADGVTYVDNSVTSIDGIGEVPVTKGDIIKVYFEVSGMNSKNASATEEPNDDISSDNNSTKSKAKVTVSKKTVTIAAGKSATISYKALDKAGKSVKASAKTSSKKLATVKVTSKTKVKISVPKKATKGSSAKITLTSAGKKATITVKVANPVKSAKAAKKTVTVKKGKKATVTVKVTAQNKKKATTDKITAKSSKSKIAKVTGTKASKGKVTVTVKGAKKGTSKLTIKVGKKTVKVTVKVK